MRPMILAALAGGAILAWGPATARADSIYDLEHARGNARAGGPISELDAELLERWGALSGTPDWRRNVRSPSYWYHHDGAPARHVRRGYHRRLSRD